MVILSMVATPSLYFWRQEPLLFHVLLFIVYYCYGTQLSVYTALTGDSTDEISRDQLRRAAARVGICGRARPVIGSRVYVSTGTYQYAFFGSAILACAALGLLSLVRRRALRLRGRKSEVRSTKYDTKYEYEVRIRSTNTKYDTNIRIRRT